MKIVVSMEREPAGGWRAWVPELPGCAVRAQSQQEISRKIDQAIRGYLASWDVADPHDLEEELVQVACAEVNLEAVPG